MAFFGLFGNKGGERRPSAIPLTLTNMILLVVGALVILQAVGLVFGKAFGFTVALGPIFMLLGIIMSSAISVAVLKRMLNDTQITKEDTIAVIVSAGIAIFVLFFLRDFIPEIFVPAVAQIQAFVGL